MSLYRWCASNCGFLIADLLHDLPLPFRNPHSAIGNRATAFFWRRAHRTDTVRRRAKRYCAAMDDRHAALLLAGLALAGAGVRYALTPASAAAPGDVRLAATDTPPPRRLRESARTSSRACDLTCCFRVGYHRRLDFPPPRSMLACSFPMSCIRPPQQPPATSWANSS